MFLRSLEPKAKQDNIHIALDCPEDILIFSYPGAIAQITNNLVVNSITHAFPPGDGGEISIKVVQTETRVELTYADNGCKLDESTKEKLFEPFYTTKRGQGGSGLGAHIVYNLVTQKLKGSIHLSTEQEQGKSFIISIPSNVAKRPN